MAKQYVVSIDTTLPETQQNNIVSKLEDHGFEVINKMLPVGSVVISAIDNESLQKAKKINGVLAIEEDTDMHAL